MAKEISLDLLVPHYYVPRPINWPETFGRTAPLDVEIGSGHGDFLIRSAQENADRDFVGIEQEWERVKTTLRKCELKQNRGSPRRDIPNIRLLQADAALALERLFLPASIENIYCLFPCPWPKKKHIKHRLFSTEFLRLANSRLKERGEITLVTDDHPFFAWVLEQLPDTGFGFQQNRIKPRFDTKYERKWSSQGQSEFFELHLVKTQHNDIPLIKDTALRIYLTKEFNAEKFQRANVTDPPTVIFKDFIFDPQRQKAMVQCIVSEKNLSQHVWIAIIKSHKGWSIAKAEGHLVIPTPGVARAITLVAQSAAQSSGSEFWATDEPHPEI